MLRHLHVLRGARAALTAVALVALATSLAPAARAQTFITSVSGVIGGSAHVTVYDQNGVAIPPGNLSAGWGMVGSLQTATVSTDSTGFVLTYTKAGSGSLTFTENDGGGAHATLTVNVASNVTGLQFSSP